MKNKTVIITGASQGIGQCLAQQLAKAGARVIMLARSKQRLSALENSLQQQGYQAESLVVDLTSEDEIKNVFSAISQKYGFIDILINNAAVGLFSTVRSSALGDSKTIFATNFFAPLLCIQQVLPLMKNKGGLIVNISSAISKHSSAWQGIYAASKAALDRLSEAVNLEESPHHVRVLSIYVDRTRTNFRHNLIGPKNNYVLPFEGLSWSKPETVAAKIISALATTKRIHHCSYKSKLFAAAAGIAPSFIYRLFQKQFNLAQANRVSDAQGQSYEPK